MGARDKLHGMSDSEKLDNILTSVNEMKVEMAGFRSEFVEFKRSAESAHAQTWENKSRLDVHKGEIDGQRRTIAGLAKWGGVILTLVMATVAVIGVFAV